MIVWLWEEAATQMKISRASVRQNVFCLDCIGFWHIDNRRIFTLRIIKSCQNQVPSRDRNAKWKRLINPSFFYRYRGNNFLNHASEIKSLSVLLIRKWRVNIRRFCIFAYIMLKKVKTNVVGGNLVARMPKIFREAGYLSNTLMRSSIFIEPSNVLINIPFLSYMAR